MTLHVRIPLACRALPLVVLAEPVQGRELGVNRLLDILALAGRSVKHHMVEMYNTCTSGGRRVRMPLPKVSIELARTTDHGGLRIAW